MNFYTRTTHQEDTTDDLLDYYNDLYKKDYKGFVRIRSNTDNRVMHIDVNTMLKTESRKKILSTFNEKDLYISFNTFKTMKDTNGTENNLFTINAICLDLDYRMNKDLQNLSPLQVYSKIKFIFNELIPEPNYIEYSNQLRLIYILNTPMKLTKAGFSNQISLYKRIVQVFNDNLNLSRIKVHPDYQGPASYIRVPGSINSKNGGWKVYIKKISDYKWSLQNMIDYYLPELPVWYNDYKSKPKKHKKKKYPNSSVLNKSRIDDLILLQQYNNKQGIYSGYREVSCYLYYVFSYLDAKNKVKDAESYAKQMTFRYNNGFINPLQEHQLWSNIRSTKLHKMVGMKNETILRLLGMSKEEAEEIGMSCASTKSGAQRVKEFRLRKKEEKRKKELAVKTVKDVKEKKSKYSLFLDRIYEVVWNGNNFAHIPMIAKRYGMSIKSTLKCYIESAYIKNKPPKLDLIAKYLPMKYRQQNAALLNLNIPSKVDNLLSGY